jgi:TPR repeat protein
MENNNCTQGLYSYQNANLSDEEVIKHFVVRKHEYDRIISEIRRDDMSGSIQHYLLIGRRGSGKSTLLSRIKAEVNLDEKLNKKLIVVYLSEEQAGVYRLHDLWDLILRDLDARKIKIDNPLWTAVEEDTAAYSKSLYYSIQKTLKKENRKLLLLLDNIDRIFDNIGEDAHLLRELLTNYKDLRIIGGSTRMSEHYWRYDKPFYQFFRIIRMESLTKEEVHQLLQYWSDCLNQPEIKQFIEKNPGKIETIRVLTDGMPRTLQNFIEILIDRRNQNGFEYLRMILDRATPVYQERLNYLPPAQRKIVLELSNFWDAVKVNQIIQACKMPGKTISAQLNNLVQNEIVEKIKGLKKDNLYRLSERFFNLWLLMTQGGPREKRQVRYLTVFLESWYDQSELLALCKEHLESLDSGKLRPGYAAIMATALAHSKFLSISERDAVIQKTRSLKESIAAYLDFLPPSSMEIYDQVKKKISSGDLSGARLLLDSIEQEDPLKDFAHGFICQNEKDFSNAEKHYLFAIAKGQIIPLFNLAILYKDTNRNEEAEKYYLLAIAKGDVKALYNLAILYQDTGRNEEAEKYYLLAIEKGIVEAFYNLAILYEDTGRNEEAEKYYLLAIEKGHLAALINLALLFNNTNRNEEAEKYFLLAIEKGEVIALYNLAVLYYTSNKNKSEALALFDKYLLKSDDLQAKAFQLVLLLWSGNITLFLKKFPLLLPELIDKNEVVLLDALFQDCLIHHQSTYLWQWFSHPEYGEKLKEMIKPVYYVFASYIEGQEEETLKPGPELEESITGISNYILERQKFYYG